MNLYIKQKIFSFRDKYDIYDSEQNPIYNAYGEIFSLGNKLHLCNSNNEELVFIKQKIMVFLPTFELYVNNELFATLKQKFTFFKKNIEIESTLGNFTISGDIWDHEYSITCNGQLFGTVSKKWLSWGDVYALNINTDEHSEFFVALVLAIDCILEAENSAAMNN